MGIVSDTRMIRKNVTSLASMANSGTFTKDEIKTLERESLDALSRIEEAAEVKLGSRIRFAAQTIRLALEHQRERTKR